MKLSNRGSDNYLPAHTYLLAQQGAPIIELVNLEALARDRVYEFAFIGASLKFRRRRSTDTTHRPDDQRGKLLWLNKPFN